MLYLKYVLLFFLSKTKTFFLSKIYFAKRALIAFVSAS